MKKYIVIFGMFCLVNMNTHTFGFATLTAPPGGDTIVLDTNVNDVEVYLNGVLVGKKGSNSFVYKVARSGDDQVFTFKKSGYKDATVTLRKATTPMFWGNVLIGGLIGSSTDSIFTKNSMEYSPSQYYVQLDKN